MTDILPKQASDNLLAKEENLLNWNNVLEKLKRTFGSDIYESWISNINLIKEFQPNIIVNTAAHSSVDLCEKNHKIADQLHVEVTQDITDISKDIDSKLI